MRLAWLTEHYPPGRGGMAVSCDRIVQGLRDRGAHIRVLLLKHGAATDLDLHRSPEIGGERLRITLGKDTAHGLRALYARELSGANDSVDAFVAFGGTLPVLAAPVFAAWARRPLVLLLRGNDFDTALFNPARRSMLADACTRAAAILTVSRDMAEKLSAWLPGRPVASIPNGIDTTCWHALPSDHAAAAELRQGLEFAAGTCVFLLAGDLKAKKGLNVLAQALADTRLPTRPGLLIAGAVSTTDRGLVDALAARTDFRHLPARDRHGLIPLMLAADSLLLPSLYDGMPNTLLEATALACPVLGSACAGVTEVLADFPDCLARPGDAADLAGVLARFIAMPPQQRKELGRAQQAHVLSAYTAAAEGAAYMRKFVQILGGSLTSA
ncbi:MAG: glycosyltransferase family 4 protein [Rhodocyclaceae bacterium]|nr:glycosyltransferase family 4 protein [Rhodocyclaceae bacterium]MBX3669363.1 glycosyltransferase family 4 protein [Rhodocyclaceae bacterium]